MDVNALQTLLPWGGGSVIHVERVPIIAISAQQIITVTLFHWSLVLVAPTRGQALPVLVSVCAL